MRRVLLAGGALCIVAGTASIAWPRSVRADTPGSGLGAFSVQATAPGSQFTYNYPGATPSPQAEGEVPESLVQLQSGPQSYALSSVAWPGPLVGNPGSTAQVLNLPIPSSISNNLTYPVRAEARNSGPTSANYSAQGANMNAAASDTTADADAVVAGTSGPAPQSGSGDTETKSSAQITGPSTVKGTASSLVQNVSLAGGVVKIASVSSSAVGTADPSSASASGTLVVSGMEIGGQPAYVDQNGLHLGQSGPGAPVNALASTLANQALAGAGMKFAVTQPETQHTAANSITYTAGTLLFFWNPPNDPHGDSFSAQFGGASVTVSASAGFSANIVDTGATPVASNPASSASLPTPAGTPASGPSVPSGGSSLATATPVASGGSAPLASGGSGSGAGSGSSASSAAVTGPDNSGLALTHGIPPIGPILVILGSVGVAAALRRLPDRVLEKASDACLIGEQE